MKTTDTLPTKLEKIVQRFEQIQDSRRRYEYLLSFAKKVPELSAAECTPYTRVPGCVSQVHVVVELSDEGKVKFRGTSDAQITKGLLGILITGLEDLTPAEILQLTPNFIERTGLNVSLTPSRSNGFYNMFRYIQQQAAVLGATPYANWTSLACRRGNVAKRSCE